MMIRIMNNRGEFNI